MDIAQFDNFLKKINAADIHINSYNNFVLHELPLLIQNTSAKFETAKKDFSFKLEFYAGSVGKACALKNGQYKPIIPALCRKENMSYTSPVYASIKQTTYDSKGIQVDVQYNEHVVISHIPVMLFSALCHCTSSRQARSLESPDDKGGYFIINGVERVLVTQRRKFYNVPQVLQVGDLITVNMRSMSKETNHSVLLEFSTLKGIPPISCSLPYITKKVPLAVLSTAFGVGNWETLYDDLGIDCQKLKKDLAFCFEKEYTEEEALEYISNLATKKQQPCDIEEDEEESDDSEIDDDDLVSETEAECCKKMDMQFARQILNIEMFPHLGFKAPLISKYKTFCTMLRNLLLVKYGFTTAQNRDNLAYHRFEPSGILLYELYNMFLRNFLNSVKEYGKGGAVTDFASKLDVFMTKNIKTCMATGKWGIQKGSYIRQGVSQVLSRQSILGTQSHLHRVMLPVGKEGKNVKVRQIHASQFGYICLFETPEGQGCGIVLNFTTSVLISSDYPPPYIRDVVVKYCSDYLCDRKHNSIDVWINNVFCMQTARARDLLKHLEYLREIKVLPFDISLSGLETIDGTIYEIRILSEKGRVIRPLLNPRGKLVYLDPCEIQTKTTAMNREEFSSGKYDYCELHPILLMSICSGSIPYSDHIQSPRIVYESSMLKQAIGFFAANFPIRHDTTCEVLDYPQKCLLSTRVGRAFGMHDMPAGINCIVAIKNEGSWNAEDCLVMHKQAVQRGLFASTTYKTITVEEYKIKTNEARHFCLPDKSIRKEIYNYDFLDENGIVKKGSRVKAKDVLVGCVMEVLKKDGGKPKQVLKKDCSELADEEGIVEKAELFRTFLGHRMVIITLKIRKIPERGDKFANLNAQKGTNGIQLSTEDMPFCIEDGIVPDILVNPNALPSRMTISMLMEIILGQECCIGGSFKDATPFEKVDVIGDVLHANGYEKNGLKRMIDGTTGEMFEAQIFCGVNYYQKLKHMVSNKINARNFGNVTALTRQPVSGRSRKGGIRLGEMEIQNLLAKGAGAFLLERLVSCSDKFCVLICGECGIISNHKDQCHLCQGELYETSLPYSSKLVFQLLNSCLISTKFQIEQV